MKKKEQNKNVFLFFVMSTILKNGKVRGMEGEKTWELRWKGEGRGKNKARGNG